MSFDLTTATTDQCLMLAEMSDERGYPFRYMASNTGVTERECRRIVRQFRDLGLASYGPLFDEDEGLARGSGYWLTRHGWEARQEMLRLAGRWLDRLPIPATADWV